MKFREYQIQAAHIDFCHQDTEGRMIAILGLLGEAGSLATEYKKYLRDGDSHRLFSERIAEELGDILWYVTSIASQFGLDLEQLAEKNIEKCNNRWSWRDLSQETSLISYDKDFPMAEQLPRKIEVEIFEFVEHNSAKVQIFVNGKQVGNDLTDNSYDDDGYRFHDVFHLSYAAILGWSPVTRQMLNCKRKSNSKTDEVEDGGRAKAIEEAISALIFSSAKDYNFFSGITELDYNLLETVKKLTSHLEISQCSLSDWEKAIFAGYDVWRAVNQNGGGILLLDLNTRSITYQRSQSTARSHTPRNVRWKTQDTLLGHKIQENAA